MEVKITPDIRNDRHHVTLQGFKLADMTAAAEAVAKSAGCDVESVTFVGAYGNITAEYRRSLTTEEYIERSRR